VRFAGTGGGQGLGVRNQETGVRGQEFLLVLILLLLLVFCLHAGRAEEYEQE
jgi:hypothetical protein